MASGKNNQNSNNDNNNKNDLTTHFKYMRLALNQASQALLNNEVPVGCIFVYDNHTILSTGMNNTNDTLSGITHAELTGIQRILATFSLLSPNNEYDAVRELKIQKLFSKVDLYVTVEPCVMCGSALRQLGIRRVFFGAGNDRFGGNGSILSLNRDDLGINSDNYRTRCLKAAREKTGKAKKVTGLKDMGEKVLLIDIDRDVRNSSDIIKSNGDFDILTIESFDRTYPSYPDFGREEAIILLRKFYVQENKKAPVPQTRESDNRFLSLTNFPVLKYEKYVTEQQFKKMYGIERMYRWHRAHDESSRFVTEDNIEVENFFEPLMPIKQDLFDEIKQWEKNNGVVVIDGLHDVRIDDSKDVDQYVVSEEDIDVEAILKDIEEDVMEGDFSDCATNDEQELPLKKQKI